MFLPGDDIVGVVGGVMNLFQYLESFVLSTFESQPAYGMLALQAAGRSILSVRVLTWTLRHKGKTTDDERWEEQLDEERSAPRKRAVSEVDAYCRPASENVAESDSTAVSTAQNATALGSRDFGTVGNGSQHVGPATPSGEGTSKAHHGDVLGSAA